VLDAGGIEVSRVMEAAETLMSSLAGHHGPLLGGHARATISAGGKRLRPLLVCLSAGVPAPETDALVRSAAAVELVHAATLVHDDVLDGSSLRRGHPTVFASGGRLAATATGDLLFSRAFATLAAEGDRQLVWLLSRASSELAAGELMQRADAWKADIGIERYFERCRLKTAVLFRVACELGASCGGGAIDAMATFGEQIGLAFQLLDDVLDITGPPERTGKPLGADLLDGTVTLPLILARQRSRELAQMELRAIQTAGQAAEACARIAATGVLADVRERALTMVAAAKRKLPGLPARQRDALALVADGVVERYA
jgi:geranylgeranyl pyrophosphate synthase